jgi:hemolysin III
MFIETFKRWRRNVKPYSDREELMHSLTHWLSTIIFSLGGGALITLASLSADAWKIASVSIFVFSMVFLYSASTLYHDARKEKAKRKLKILDHVAIYILIAGTYTPFTLINMRGAVGWTLFGVIWGVALAGTVKDLFLIGKYKKFSLFLYMIMGGMIFFSIKPFLETVPGTGIIFLILGGVFYYGGVYFYVRKDKEFYHGIWHLFVFAGTLMHYFAVLFACVLPLVIR